METKVKRSSYRTVEQVEQRIQKLQLLILDKIEKQNWKRARALSRSIGDCIRRKIGIQNSMIKELPLFFEKEKAGRAARAIKRAAIAVGVFGTERNNH